MSGIRITGGEYKGRTIAAPTGGPARLTSAKVREAVFDLVGGVEGEHVLDLFGGAGSFTAEALSRGAASVTTVEVDRHAVALIRRNIKALGEDKRCLVLGMDVRYAVPMLHRQGRRFDLIFVDPPYEMGHVASTMELLKKHPVWQDSSTVIFEHSKREELNPIVSGCGQVKVKRYGDTALTILHCGPREGRSPLVGLGRKSRRNTDDRANIST